MTESSLSAREVASCKYTVTYGHGTKIFYLLDKISIEEVRQFVLEVPELLAAAAGDELVEGEGLLLGLQRGEPLHHGLQPARELRRGRGLRHGGQH